MRCAIVIEKAGEGFSAYVPDLPGCIATGPTRQAVEREIVEAIRLHVAGLREDGQFVPAPTPHPKSATPLDGCVGDDPFLTFVEWGGEADTADYADL